MHKPPSKHRLALIYLVLILVTLGTFWPVLRCDFVRYDDDKYVTENPYIKGGLSLESAAGAFTRPHYHMWHPLTTLSYIVDYEIFGLNPLWYHLVNLLFHLANTVLLFCVLKRLTGAVWPSVFVAAVFAVHPLQVESVAWVAERKNVLSGFFFLLTIAAYARYADRPSAGRYLLVIACLSLGLMAKPIVVTLPLALLLLDYWPLDRIRWAGQDERAGPRRSQLRNGGPQYSPWRLLAEKVPMFGLAGAVAVVTYAIQRAGGVLSELSHIPPPYRLANASISYVTYIEKLIWPSGLAVFYPHPAANFSVVRLAISIPVLLLLSTLCIYLGRRQRYLAVGWLWHLGLLVPVIGLIQAGAQARADRYMYLTMIGPLVIAAWGAGDLVKKWRLPKVLPAVAAGIIVSAAITCTSLQLRYWRSSMALFKRAVDVTENNYIMLNNYANRLSDAGRIDEAIECFCQCLLIRPDSPEPHNNLGNALLDRKQIDAAIEHYRQAVELAEGQKRGSYPPSGLAEAHHNLANALRLQGRFDQAAEHYAAALKVKPDDIGTLQGLALTYSALQKYDDAIACYDRMLRFEPDNVIAHGLLGIALGQKGEPEAAANEFRFVLSRRPDDLEMYCNLGIVLQQQGRIDEAIDQYRQALQIDPDYGKARQLLQAALEKQKNR